MRSLRLPRASFSLLLPLAFVFGTGGGCSGAPRSRLGALPFPGRTTLYKTADPQDLGRHRYGSMPRLFGAGETSRGILYTTRAGFLDLAHVRITIDKARYCARAFHRAMDKGESRFKLPGPNRSVWHVTISEPAGWAELPASERAALSGEASIRAGQRLAYLMLTWHELITWFGYRNVFVIDERRSSFLHDDVMSHVVGLRVADRAMRALPAGADPLGDDDAFTAALAAELAELGAVPPACTTEAARAVENLWWADAEPLKRQPDVGLSSGVVKPWLVPGVACASSPAQPEAFPLPRLDDVLGYDLSGFFTVEVDPRILEAGRIRAHLPARPARFSADRDIPALLEVVRAQMHAQINSAVDQPWPAASGLQAQAPTMPPETERKAATE